MLGMRWKALGRALNMSQVAAQGDAALQAFCDALFGVRELEVAFSIVPFLSIDAVGSGLLARLLEYIDCGTHRRTPRNSSIKLSNVRVLDLVGVCSFWAQHLLIVLSSLGRFRWP